MADTRIKKMHWSVIDHSISANGMHTWKMRVVCSSSPNSAIVYFPLFRMKAEYCGNGCIQYLRSANLAKRHYFHCYWDTTQKVLERNIGTAEKLIRKEDCSLQVCVIGPT